MEKDLSTKSITIAGSKHSVGDGITISTLDINDDFCINWLSLIVPIFIEKGYKVEVYDWNDQTVDWKTKQNILLAATWEYFTNIDAFHTWLNILKEAKINVINPVNFTKWNSTKAYLLDLKEENINILPTLIYIPESESDFNLDKEYSKIIQVLKTNDIIIKGLHDGGATSYNHFKLENDSSIGNLNIIKDVINTNKGIIFQPFCNYFMKGELCFTFLNGVYTTGFIRLPVLNEEKTQSKYGSTTIVIDSENLDMASKMIVDNRPDLIFYNRCYLENIIENVKLINSKLLSTIFCRSEGMYPVFYRLDVVIDEHNQVVVNEIEGIEPDLQFEDIEANLPELKFLNRYIETIEKFLI